MKRKSGINKSCLSCNKEFYVEKSQIHIRKYCCHQCSVKKGENSQRWTGGLTELKCLNCNNSFFVKKNHAEKGIRKFCSTKCRSLHNINNKNLYKKTTNNCICKLCSKEFHLKPSAIQRGRGSYCSKLCQDKDQEKTMIGNLNPNYRHGMTYKKGFYKETNRRWRMNNRHIVSMHSRRQKAIRRNATGSFKTSEIKDLIIKQNYKCNNCNISIKNKYHVDHIMPIKLGGNNFIDNIQLLCPSCNMRKGSKHPIQWAKENGRLF